MFKIAICEDEIIYYEKHKEVIDSVFKEKSLDYKIDYYPSGEELIAACQENKYDIVIMDYEFKGGMNGIETSQELRKLDKDVFLIFISNYTDPAIPAFDVSAMKYIDKSSPEYAESLAETLLKCVGRIQERGASFRGFRVRDIIYLEGSGNNTKIHTVNDDVYTYRGTLADAEERLRNYWFQRIHKSTLINCEFVKAVLGTEIILYDKRKLNIGRKYLHDFRIKYAEILLREL